MYYLFSAKLTSVVLREVCGYYVCFLTKRGLDFHSTWKLITYHQGHLVAICINVYYKFLSSTNNYNWISSSPHILLDLQWEVMDGSKKNHHLMMVIKSLSKYLEDLFSTGRDSAHSVYLHSLMYICIEWLKSGFFWF